MDFISYEEFGVNFVELAVTTERIRRELEDAAGGTIQIGPLPAGPGGVAVVKADGAVGDIELRRHDGPPITFDANLSIDLNLEVRLAGIPHRYRAAIDVPLSLVVRTVPPLTLLIEIEPVAARDVDVDLRSSGLSAGMLQRLGNMEDEVRGRVARVVNERIDSEPAKATREIDIALMIEHEMRAEGD